MNEKLQLLAKDLTKEFPRSPRELLGGFVIAARALDKCRAVLAGIAGEYHFDCPLDRMFFDATGIDSAAFQAEVEKGATDAEMSAWVDSHATLNTPEDIAVWNPEHMGERKVSDKKLRKTIRNAEAAAVARSEQD
jgi:hypothetical protein